MTGAHRAEVRPTGDDVATGSQDHLHANPMGMAPHPHTRLAGAEGWGGWWVYPVLLLLVTFALIVVAAAIIGSGPESGSAASGQVNALPRSAPATP